MKEQSLMTQRVINEGVSKEDDILKVDIRKKVNQIKINQNSLMYMMPNYILTERLINLLLIMYIFFLTYYNF